MNVPAPLPEPGWWLVMPDGSQYEVRHCAPEHCTITLATAEGVYCWSADDGEALWTTWDAVDSIHATPEAAHLRADAIEAEPQRMTVEDDGTHPYQ